MRRNVSAIAAAASIMLIIPISTFISVLLLGMMMQAQLSGQAAVRQAELEAETGKMLLRASIIKGESNTSLVHMYGAGKLPITVDYLLVELHNGTILVEKSGEIMTIEPGMNITAPVSSLDQRLAVYDNDFWRMRREVRQLILHSSDGSMFYIGWGPLYTQRAVVVLGNQTFTTSTTTSTQTTTSTSYITSTETVTITTTPRIYTVYTTVTIYRQWTTSTFIYGACYFSCNYFTTFWFPYITRWVGPTVTTTIGPFTQPFIVTTITRTVVSTATPATVTYVWGGSCYNPSCTGGTYYAELTTTVTSSTTFTYTVTLTATG